MADQVQAQQASERDIQAVQKLNACYQQIKTELGKVIVGQAGVIDELLIAMPSATRTQLRAVVELCQGTGLRFKTLPAMEDLIAGRATVSEID
jgi:FlaA1/EpsC-like NDP-sugar epimerase